MLQLGSSAGKVSMLVPVLSSLLVRDPGPNPPHAKPRLSRKQVVSSGQKPVWIFLENHPIYGPQREAQ